MWVAHELADAETTDPLKLSNHLFGGFYDAAMTANAERILVKLAKRFGTPNCGRNRAVFHLKNNVLKFPLNPAGESDNDWEASCSSEHYAKGRHFNIDGFICVVQEKLTPIELAFPDDELGRAQFLDCLNNLPTWTHYIDNQQVGYSKKGELKAYDFGRH